MRTKCARIAVSLLTVLSLTVSAPGGLWAHTVADGYTTTTPIKHLVVIFQENVSFDHYFATYPYAQNTTPGEPTFTPRENTPSVNNLLSGNSALVGGLLLTNNPNTVQPFRLGKNQAVTCDQGHNYTPEQQAADHGLMDNFVAATGTGNVTNGIIPASLPFGIVNPLGETTTTGTPLQPGQYYEKSTTAYQGYCYDAGKGPGVVMGYYDGNTVTALWNYAQHFAMSDNSWDTSFGPSAPGAINVVAGNTCCFTAKPSPDTVSRASGDIWGGHVSGVVTGALIGDSRPYLDDCDLSNTQLAGSAVAQANETAGVPANVGDLMGDIGFPNGATGTPITWGWFMGGFAPTKAWGGTSTTPAVCGSAGIGIAGFGYGALPDNITTVGDYIPHHQPFQYYTSSWNPHHLLPTETIGTNGQANHQYDLSAFYTALQKGELPAVSYLKAPAYQDGHPGYSDPLDEQYFIVNTINMIMASDEWKSTAIVVMYDDSDGWYDHQPSPIVNQSGASGNADDVYATAGFCGLNAVPSTTSPWEGRCGYGTRQPLLVISPWARENFVDHGITDQSSIVKFIEDNWFLPRLADSSDAKAGTLNNMFDFDESHYNNGYGFGLVGFDRQLILSPSNGEVVDFGLGF